MIGLVPILLLVGLPMVLLLWRRAANARQLKRRTIVDQKQSLADHDPYRAIAPLQDFDWKTTPPIHNSPLKPKYHLTMALENVSLDDIIAMDDTYADRMNTRRTIMQEHRSATLQCTPAGKPAVMELYEWMFYTYLSKRFPRIYHPTSSGLLNTANNETIPWEPSSSVQALETLGAHVDTDIILLLPSKTAADGSPIYCLEAFVVCFPAGFSLSKKVGFPLAEIHAPVPGYKAKLEKSMDRFFARIECGRAVKRSNWAITTDDRLFTEEGNHLYGDDEAGIERQKRDVVPENCRLRSERQTLFRLPKTKALVFSFKTYQYTLEEVRKEGYAEELARAVEGLAKGNVPEMEYYKRGVVWGTAVVEYLRR